MQSNESAPYGLSRPTIAEARGALDRLYGDAGPRWRVLLDDAGLSGHETDVASLRRLLAVMCEADPVTALCARSLSIRLATYEHLTNAHDLIRSAE